MIKTTTQLPKALNLNKKSYTIECNSILVDIVKKDNAIYVSDLKDFEYVLKFHTLLSFRFVKLRSVNHTNNIFEYSQNIMRPMKTKRKGAFDEH